MADNEKERMLDLIIEKDEQIRQLEEKIGKLKEWNKMFFGRVRYMRECQKEYFKERGTDALHKSKALEKEVDEEIDRIVKGLEQREARQMLIKEFDCVQEYEGQQATN